jgi:hypothetical protein
MRMYGRLQQISEAWLGEALANPEHFYANFSETNGTNPNPTGGVGGLRAEASNITEQVSKQALASASYKKMQKSMELLRSKKISLEEYQKDAQTFQEECVQMVEDAMAEARRLAPELGSQSSAESDATEIDLGESWHCLHFLLTGNVWPDAAELHSPVLGGHEIPDKNGVMVYGPVRYLGPEEVADGASCLENFPISEKAEAYDAANGASLQIYCPEHGKSEIEYFFDLLLRFYQDCAAKRNAALLWIERF